MSNKSKPNNRMYEAGASNEGLSLGRYPIGEQDWYGRHQTTADRKKTRKKWSQEENRVVMQCSYRSECGQMVTGRECMSSGMKWECLM